MALKITDDCINCGACEPECPNHAIYENGVQWRYSDGTQLTLIELEDGSHMDGNTALDAVSNDFYYIVPSKCTECVGFHEEPQCAAVCPVDCCVPDPENAESNEDLLAKKAWLHAELVYSEKKTTPLDCSKGVTETPTYFLTIHWNPRFP